MNRAKTRSAAARPPAAVVLLSGGLDSATVLALAVHQGYRCHALSIEYGQRHRVELEAARNIAPRLGAFEHRVVSLDLGFLEGSALLDASIAVPESPPAPEEPGRGSAAAAGEREAQAQAAHSIPVTYVPARNTILLSLALAWAEALQARHVFLGVNEVDYSGYPDCRPAYLAAWQEMANFATRAALEGRGIQLHAPLVACSKAQIIRQGMELGVEYERTVSCYQATGSGAACGRCDSCRIRRAGFASLGLRDPTRYQQPAAPGLGGH